MGHDLGKRTRCDEVGYDAEGTHARTAYITRSKRSMHGNWSHNEGGCETVGFGKRSGTKRWAAWPTPSKPEPKHTRGSRRKAKGKGRV